jgi:thioredoxin 1
MTNTKKAAIIAGVVIAAAAAMVLKQSGQQDDRRPPTEEVAMPAAATAGTQAPAKGQALPRLVDLGAHSCIPCKMMAPILEELKKEFAGVFKTEFVDVWQNQEPARKYGIRVIPTQIFFDAEGKELFRHEGFYSKEDILAKWKEFGF